MCGWLPAQLSVKVCSTYLPTIHLLSVSVHVSISASPVRMPSAKVDCGGTGNGRRVATPLLLLVTVLALSLVAASCEPHAAQFEVGLLSWVLDSGF